MSLIGKYKSRNRSIHQKGAFPKSLEDLSEKACMKGVGSQVSGLRA